MTQRNLFPLPQMPMMNNDQIWSHPFPDPHSHLGAENAAFRLPVHGAAKYSSFKGNRLSFVKLSYYAATNLGLSHDPYLHHSSTASSSRFPPPRFISIKIAPLMLKQILQEHHLRQSPARSMAIRESKTSGYYTAGSPSNLHIYSNHLQPRSLTRSWPLDPSSITHNYDSDNVLPAGEEFQRNVRTGHDHTFQVDINPSSNLPCHFHAAGNLSGLNMEGQFSHASMPIAPLGRIHSSDYSFSHGRNQFLSGPGVINNTVETSSSLPASHGPLTRGVEDGSRGNSHRANPYRFDSSQTPVGFAHRSLEGGGLSGMEFIASSRYSRPLPFSGRNSYRNGRIRSS